VVRIRLSSIRTLKTLMFMFPTVPRIVREYIKQKNDPDLWKAYGKGLLQVYDIDKTIVSPPRLPSDDE
jgi:hypothetical protein